MLLYCASMCPGCHIDNTDIGILRLLRMVFGKDLFQHCILVNTFANYIPEEKIKGRAEGIAKRFRGALRQAGIPDIEVKAIQSNQDKDIKVYSAYQLAWRKTTQRAEDQLFNKKLSIRFARMNISPTHLKSKYKTAVMVMCFNISTVGMVEKIQSIKEEVGPAMYEKCVVTKRKVRKK